MHDSANKFLSLRLFPRAIVVAAIIWTVLVSGSVGWNLYKERSQTLALARKEALSNFNKDLAFRLWATKHGGVYVPATEQTPPNPYLSHIAERDLTTPSGNRLTLMNPAYMLRQMMADFRELYGIKGWITSLKPLNPDNSPDAWEQQALAAFEKGIKEVFEIEKINGSPYLRLMRPLETKKGCLKCHAQQGYKEGDIRGGVGLSVPMAPFLTLEKEARLAMSLSHFLIWVLGMAGLGLAYVRGKRLLVQQAQDQDELRTLNEQLDQRVRERTLALEKQISERQRLESSLFITQFSVDKASDSLFWIRPDASFANVNEATCHSLGYSREELLAMTVFDVDPAFSREEWASHWQEVKERKTFSIETEHRSKEGRVFPVEVSVNYVEYEGREYNFAFARDITERKHAEKLLRSANEELESIVAVRTGELAQSEQRFRALFEQASDGIFFLDTQGKVLSVNESFAQMHGYTVEEMVRLGLEMLDVKGTTPVSDRIRRIMAGETLTFDVEHRHRDGHIFSLEVTANLISIGSEQQILAIHRDITERKRADEAIQKSAKEWIAAMDASEDVIYLLDLDRRVLRANKVFFKMTGTTPATALGKHIVELVHPQGEKVPCPVCQAQEEKRDLAFVMEHDHKDNPVGRPIEIILRIVRNDEGQAMSMLMTLHDLTNERKIQEELIKHRDHLEELVKSRTAEIENQKTELERLNKLFVGRELRMIELKERIKELEREQGKNV